MRIAVGFAFELGFHRPRPRDCLAVITARIQVGDGKSALYLLRRITGNPFLVFGLVPNAQGNDNLRSIAFSMKLASIFPVTELVLPISGPSLDAIFSG